jgi:lipopolysaccharide/colanic/teichoic acid biosynthesis glycosyltransferase
MNEFSSRSEGSNLGALDVVTDLGVLEAAAEVSGYANRLSIPAVLSRGLDISVALVALLLLLPLQIVVAIAIYRDSGGPIIFRQERLGRGRQKFVLFKYRTMVPAADVEPHRAYVQALIEGRHGSDLPIAAGDGSQGSLYKLTIDPRITRTGRRLRQWSMDEIPQLINVLRGDMALVGPRPVIPYEAELYPGPYLRRFDVKPGMTGLWQVSGRNRCTYEEMVRLDVEYAERRSLWLDLAILFKTVPVVLRREGVA